MAHELRAVLLCARGLQTALRAPALAGVRRGERGTRAQRRCLRLCDLRPVGGRTAPGLRRWAGSRKVWSLLGSRIAGSHSVLWSVPGIPGCRGSRAWVDKFDARGCAHAQLSQRSSLGVTTVNKTNGHPGLQGASELWVFDP